LSVKIDAQSLASPIEAPYRLQFLQDHYQGITTVCFIRLGCINEQQRRERFDAAAWIAGIFTFGGFGLCTLCLVLTQRLTRVETLAAHAAQIRTKRIVWSAEATAS
jgi:hypothetical protein